MKILKRISLFFIYPMVMGALGFWAGTWSVMFFYPGSVAVPESRTEEPYERIENISVPLTEPEETVMQPEWEPVSVSKETLCADTEYVLEEADLYRDSIVEITTRIPAQYIGMDREQFVQAMKTYSANPPLAEKERGFVGLEVISFSPERVVVRMQYEYVKPGDYFYLAVMDHEVVVLLEDKETVYMNTGIYMDSLPEDIQLKIIQMYMIAGEDNLYHFLETYSS